MYCESIRPKLHAPAAVHCDVMPDSCECLIVRGVVGSGSKVTIFARRGHQLVYDVV
jgi:hypothetical protein